MDISPDSVRFCSFAVAVHELHGRRSTQRRSTSAYSRLSQSAPDRAPDSFGIGSRPTAPFRAYFRRHEHAFVAHLLHQPALRVVAHAQLSAGCGHLHLCPCSAPRPSASLLSTAMNSKRPESPNHALQRTAPRVTLAAPTASLRSPPAAFPQPARRAPQSLSLGSLGVATRVVFNGAFLPAFLSPMPSSADPDFAPRSGRRCPARHPIALDAVHS